MRHLRTVARVLAVTAWLATTFVLVVQILELHDFVDNPECMCFWEETIAQMRREIQSTIRTAGLNQLTGFAVFFTSRRSILARLAPSALRLSPLLGLHLVIEMVQHTLAFPPPSH